MSDAHARMTVEGLSATRWSNTSGERYAAHRHDYDKVLVAVEGSVVFGINEHDSVVELGPGDRLDLPAGTLHDALVGPAGVVCLEAHLPARTLADRPHHRPHWADTETATSPNA